ncbi:hypothetical protein BDZ89DRAFT_1146154 [Hymenopellis radicata]|nr:hypothetical protein BDZ89DRAFT_1146154 [Hymenopellis radicata]
MDLNDDPKLFLDAVPLLTKGASPLGSALFSLNYHLPQIYDYNAPIQAVDGAIRDLHRILAMIGFYRGTLAPIHGLPDDVLTHIFRFYVSEAYKGSLSWSKTMLVCRRWYSLIMSDGYLWSFIDASMRRFRLLRAQLLRSGHWPLTIYNSGPRETLPYTYHAILKDYSARIVSLHFDSCSMPHNLMLQALERQFPSCFPPEMILALPKLHRLTLEDLIIPSDQFPAHLTELNLSHFRSNSVPSYDLHQFFDNLSRSPHLEVLKIAYAVENFSPVQPVPSVHLPHLRVLSIFGGGDVVTPFLTSLIIPRTARVFVRMHTRFHNASATSRVFIAPLRKYYRHYEGTRITAVRIESQKLEREEVGIVHVMRIFGLQREDLVYRKFFSRHDSERTAVEFDFFGATGRCRKRFTRKMFTSLMPQAEVLDVRTMFAHTSSWWKMALLSLPALTEVYISGDLSACSAFCQTLLKLMDTHPKSFPKLQGIYVDKETERYIKQEYEWHADSDTYSEWRDTELHKQNGVALRELVMRLKEGDTA